jgi:hypothetical protein
MLQYFKNGEIILLFSYSILLYNMVLSSTQQGSRIIPTVQRVRTVDSGSAVCCGVEVKYLRIIWMELNLYVCMYVPA